MGGMVFYITKRILVSIFINLTKVDNLNLPSMKTACHRTNISPIAEYCDIFNSWRISELGIIIQYVGIDRY